MDPRIRIHTKMSWIRNIARDIIPLKTDLSDGLLAAELLHQLEGQLTLSAIRQLYNLHQKNNVKNLDDVFKNRRESEVKKEAQISI